MVELTFTYIEAPPTRWTFEPESVREWVESRLSGRVLNLFAGQTRLSHSEEVVRNDIDPEVDADYHIDAVYLDDHFEDGEFDTVILDPPYNVRKSREKYEGRHIGDFTVVKDKLIDVVPMGGKTVHFGYDSTGMSASRGFQKEEICLINHKGDHNDTIAVVERRVESPVKIDRFETTRSSRMPQSRSIKSW